MKYDKKHFTELHETTGPVVLEDQTILETNMGFKYRKGIGELLFAAITCRPEILYAVIKLSQFSVNPAEIHYQSVKHIFRYLRDTIDYGIHYWRPSPRPDCPLLPFPNVAPDNHELPPIHQSSITEPFA